MSKKKMELSESKEIVQKALDAFGRHESVNFKDTLGHHFPNGKDREQFQEKVHALLREKKFFIEKEAIPKQAHTTLEEIAHVVAASELSGDSYSTRSHDQPPPPPPPPPARVNRDVSSALPDDPYSTKSNDEEPKPPAPGPRSYRPKLGEHKKDYEGLG